MIKQLWKFVITLVLSVTTMQGIAIERVDVSSSGRLADASSFEYTLSADGSFVVFASRATNLDPGVNSIRSSDKRYYFRSRHGRGRTLLSTPIREENSERSMTPDRAYSILLRVIDPVSGEQAILFNETNNLDISPPYNPNYTNPQIIDSVSMSADGQYVVFNIDQTIVSGSNETPVDAEITTPYVFLHEPQTGETTRIRASPGSVHSYAPRVSADGRYVSFSSSGSGTSGIYVYDRISGLVSPVAEFTDNSIHNNGSISSDGRYLTFTSDSDSLVSGDTNGFNDLFLHDRVTGNTSRISIASDGTQANGSSTTTHSSFSADGRFIVYGSDASNLIANDTNGTSDIFVYDRITGINDLAVRNTDGSQIQKTCFDPVISANGVLVIFGCYESGLVTSIYIAPNEILKQLEKDIPQDFNGDGKSDVLWRNMITGENWMYLMDGGTILASESVNIIDDLNWQVKGTGDFDGDGKADIFWRNVDTGENWIYLMDGFNVLTSQSLNFVTDMDWEVKDVADFDGNGKDDILWRHQQDGQIWMYLMDGINIDASRHVAYTGVDWEIKGVGDFDRDNKADILWRNSNHGRVWLYTMNGSSISASNHVAYTDTNWEIFGVGDHNADRKADILWHRHTGQVTVFIMSSNSILTTTGSEYHFPLFGKIAVHLRDYDGNGKVDFFERDLIDGGNDVQVQSTEFLNFHNVHRLGRTDIEWKIQ